MKRLGYYPALFVLLAFCLSLAGVFVYLSANVMKRMGSYKSSDENYKAQVALLDSEEKALEASQRSDKVYNDYFARWAEKEGRLDEGKLKQKLQKISEELGVSVLEIGGLNGVGATEKQPASGVVRERRPRPDRTPRTGPSAEAAPTGASIPAVASKTPAMIELKLSLAGPFGQLMQWIGRAENDLGSLRVVQTDWLARSPEEVRLTVGVRYKTMGGAQ